MAGKSEFEEGTVKFSVRLPESIARWYERLGGTLGKGIIEAHGILTAEDKTVEAEGSKHTRAESGTPPPLARDDPFSEEPRGPQVIGVVRTLPRVYQGGEDVTPRFKEKAHAETLSMGIKRGGRSKDSQVVDYGDDDAQPLPAYDF